MPGGFYSSYFDQRRRIAAAFSALSPLQQQALLAQIQGTNFAAPKEKKEEGFFGRLIPNVLERAMPDVLEKGLLADVSPTVGKKTSLATRQVGDALLGTIPGLFAVGKAAVLDIGHGEFNPYKAGYKAARGENPFPERTSHIAAEMGKAMWEDVTHPGERPGYLALDVLAAASLGFGAGARASAAGRTAMEVRAARRGISPEAAAAEAPPALPPALPSRSISDVVKRGPGSEPPPLVLGHQYRVRGPGGAFTGYYARTGDTAAGETHYFRTAEGRTKQLASKHLQGHLGAAPAADITWMGRTLQKGAEGGLEEMRVISEGEKLTAEALPEGVLPPAAKPIPTAQATAATERQLAADTAEVAKHREGLPDVPQEFKLERVGQEAWGNVGEGERVGIRSEGGKWRMVHERAGKVVTSHEYPGTAEGSITAARHAQAYGQSLVRGGKPSTLARMPERPAPAAVAAAPAAPPVPVAKPVEAVREPTPEGALVPREKPPTIREGIGQVARSFAAKPLGGYRAVESFTPVDDTAVTKALKNERETGQLGMPMEAELPDGYVMRRHPETNELQLGTVETGYVPLPHQAGARFLMNQWIKMSERHPQARLAPGGRTLPEYVRFRQSEASRIMAGSDPKRLGGPLEAGLMNIVHDTAREMSLEPIVERRLTPEPKPLRGAGGLEVVKRIVDSMNMMAKIFALYLKGGYPVANTGGQILLTGADHNWNPIALRRTLQLHNGIVKDKALLAQVKAGMQEQAGMSLYAQEHGLGLSQRLRRRLLPEKAREFGSYDQYVRFYNRILDEPYRNLAFSREAIRQGYNSPAKVKRLFDDPALELKLEEIFLRANKNIIDYGRLGSLEKALLRRVIFFYPWFKAATMYAGHFQAEHPIQAQYSLRMGEYGNEQAARELGPLPSYMQGVFKFGERNVPGLGKVPTVVNPRALTVLGTPGEVIQAGQAALQGGGKESTSISQYLTPAASAAIAAATHKDPFTGADIPAGKSVPDIILDEVMSTAAPLRAMEQYKRSQDLKSGRLDPTRVLFPYSGGEVAGRYMTGVWPYAVNQREARSRAFAEKTSLASRREREILKNKDYRDRYLQAGRQTRTFSQMPPELSQAFQQRARVSAELAAYESSLDHPMRQIDRLQAVVALLVRQGQMDREQARAMLQQMVAASDGQIESLKSKLTNAYFGGTVISQYRAALNASGAQLTVP
jgi:hypothetical protein